MVDGATLHRLLVVAARLAVDLRDADLVERHARRLVGRDAGDRRELAGVAALAGDHGDRLPVVAAACRG